MAGIAGPVVLITLASLATCAPRPRSMPMPPTPCKSEKLQSFFGATRSPQLEAHVKGLVGEIEVRWIAPGDAVPEDYRETRLNIHVDDNGQMRAVKCG